MSKLLDRICKIRDLMTAEDISKLPYHIGLIRETQDGLLRLTKKFIVHEVELDFSHEDLLEMADEVKLVLQKLADEINGAGFISELLTHKVIDDDLFEKFTVQVSDKFSVRAVLTEFHSVITYLAVYVKFIEDANKQDSDIGYVLTATLQSFLNGGYYVR